MSLQMNRNKEMFESMPVPQALAMMAIPTIISQLITLIYNLADTFFIGRTNDPYKVAAASLCLVLFFIMNALANLFGVGGGSHISRLLGQGHSDEAKRVCAFSVYGTILIAAAYSLGCLTFMEPMLRKLGATDNTISYCSQYMLWVVVIGGIPAALSMTMAHLLRSVGYAKRASFGLGMGGVLNILLDPLFMFVLLQPGQEVAGAAIATMLSNYLSLVYFCATFFQLHKETVLSALPRNAIPERASIVKVFAIGFPSALGTLLSSVSTSVLNNLVSGYGDIQVAAAGIVKKIDMLPMSMGMGLCQGMIPLVAYNCSAKNYKRMCAVTNTARFAGVIFALVCVVTFELFAGNLVGLFINNDETIALGSTFLRIQCLAVPLMINNFQMSYTFQAMGLGKQSLFLSACRQGIFNIPLMFVMNALAGLYGVLWTQLLADTVTLTISYAMFHRFYHTLNVGK